MPMVDSQHVVAPHPPEPSSVAAKYMFVGLNMRSQVSGFDCDGCSACTPRWYV